jgi:hypothetical protein
MITTQAVACKTLDDFARHTWNLDLMMYFETLLIRHSNALAKDKLPGLPQEIGRHDSTASAVVE